MTCEGKGSGVQFAEQTHHHQRKKTVEGSLFIAENFMTMQTKKTMNPHTNIAPSTLPKPAGLEVRSGEDPKTVKHEKTPQSPFTRFLHKVAKAPMKMAGHLGQLPCDASKSGVATAHECDHLSHRETLAAWHRVDVDVHDYYDVIQVIGQGHMGEISLVARKLDLWGKNHRRVGDSAVQESLDHIDDSDKERNGQRLFACKTVSTGTFASAV